MFLCHVFFSVLSCHLITFFLVTWPQSRRHLAVARGFRQTAAHRGLGLLVGRLYDPLGQLGQQCGWRGAPGKNGHHKTYR